MKVKLVTPQGNHILSNIVITLIISFGGIRPTDASANDYIVDLFKEQYRERMIVGGGEVKINHTWQVKTIYGTKILILIGEDYIYRKWLRQYRKQHHLFIIKIPDDGDIKFRHDMAVLVNVQQIHPVSSKIWACEKCRTGPPPPKFEGYKRNATTIPVAPEIIAE